MWLQCYFLCIHMMCNLNNMSRLNRTYKICLQLNWFVLFHIVYMDCLLLFQGLSPAVHKDDWTWDHIPARHMAYHCATTLFLSRPRVFLPCKAFSSQVEEKLRGKVVALCFFQLVIIWWVCFILYMIFCFWNKHYDLATTFSMRWFNIH